MSDVLKGQLSGKEQQLAKAKEAQLVRRAHEKAQPAEKTTLRFVDEQCGEFGCEEVTSRTLYHVLEVAEGRLASLALASGSDNLQLLAITRGDIALPIASFDNSTGKVDLGELEAQISPEKRQAIIDNLHTMISIKPKPTTYDVHYITKKDEIIAEYLIGRGLLRYARSPERGSSREVFDKKELLRQLDVYLADPTLPKPFDSKPLEQAVLGMHKNENGLATCNSLQVAKRLQAAIGPTSGNEEELFNQVQSMANRFQSRVVIAKKRQIGNTLGNAKVRADITKQGTIYNVRLSGRPLSQADAELVPLPSLSLNFDYTQPLFDRQKMSDEEAADRAKEILDILNLF